jgi:hypothetical protein
MLVNEVISAEGKLELWRMVSDSMWAALDAQARAELAAKAERAAVRKPRKRSARAAKPKSVPPPRSAAQAAKPSGTAANTPATQQPPTQPSTPVQQPSAIGTGVQQANAANAEVAATAKPKPNMPQGATLLARARGVLDDAV